MIFIRQLTILCLVPFLCAALSAATIYVDDDALNDPGPGDPTVSDPLEDGSENHPYDAIQEGIDAATDGVDDVIVKDGTYSGAENKNLDFGGKAITIESESGAASTIIDCEDSGQGFYFRSNETLASIVDGFTIKNGSTTYGGAIRCDHSSPTITNCTISNNSGSRGGGILCYYSSATITNCTISGNSAGHRGGGIFCNYYSNPTITNCTISGNSAGDNGGGIYCYYICNPAIANCTINDNSATTGGGFFCDIACNATMTNCILWGNTAPNGHEIAVTSASIPSTLTVRYSDVEGGIGEAYIESGCTLDLDGTNIDSDPLFVLGPLGDYYLSHVVTGQPADSPCVDSGSDTATNLNLDTRTTRSDSIPDAGTVDMGYHYPIDSAPWISWIEKVGDNVTITWEAETGISYIVEYSADVTFGSHTDVPVGETDTWTDVGGALESQRYYRVREQ